MNSCSLCGRRSRLVSAALGVCGTCITAQPDRALPLCARAHTTARAAFGLPVAPPRAADGRRCSLCSSECEIGEAEHGYCGLRTNRGDRLVHLAGLPARGHLQWYRDPLPTNCVADWVCPGSASPGEHNLAVFYQSCTLDCLFCQNWHFRATPAPGTSGTSAEALAGAARPDTYCVCFFGGDPASQMTHAIDAGRRLARRGVTVCWETAGTSHPKLLDEALRLSIATGGCIKFDLKAFDEALHMALTGGSNRRTLENFARVAPLARKRPDWPLVVASTLLVPGYVGEAEVGRIAAFIADLDPHIPYALLAFAPSFRMADLPRTSALHAAAAEAAARDAGLTNVRVGNRHLLSSPC